MHIKLETFANTFAGCCIGRDTKMFRLLLTKVLYLAAQPCRDARDKGPFRSAICPVGRWYHLIMQDTPSDLRDLGVLTMHGQQIPLGHKLPQELLNCLGIINFFVCTQEIKDTSWTDHRIYPIWL